MKVRARDPAAHDSIGGSVFLLNKVIDRFQRLGSAHVDLVSGNPCAKEGAALGLNGQLLAAEFGFGRQQLKSFQASALFHPKWIGYVSAQHLISAADSENPSAMFQRVEQQCLEASLV